MAGSRIRVSGLVWTSPRINSVSVLGYGIGDALRLSNIANKH